MVSLDVANEVLRLDLDFSATGFSRAEAYRDTSTQQRLAADLVAAGLPN